MSCKMTGCQNRPVYNHSSCRLSLSPATKCHRITINSRVLYSWLMESRKAALPKIGSSNQLLPIVLYSWLIHPLQVTHNGPTQIKVSILISTLLHLDCNAKANSKVFYTLPHKPEKYSEYDGYHAKIKYRLHRGSITQQSQVKYGQCRPPPTLPSITNQETYPKI